MHPAGIKPSHPQLGGRFGAENLVLGASHPFHPKATAPGKHTARPAGKSLIALGTFLQRKSCMSLHSQTFILKDRKGLAFRG